MDEVKKYIDFRYQNWLDYANYKARINRFDTWGEDLLNDCLLALLCKDEELLKALHRKKTRKIVNGQPTTELDKFILRMMNLNAYSQSAPFRQHTLGQKILHRKSLQTAHLVPLDKHDFIDEPELNQEIKLDEMHKSNLQWIQSKDSNEADLRIYKMHFIESFPLKEMSEPEKRRVKQIENYLVSCT